MNWHPQDPHPQALGIESGHPDPESGVIEAIGSVWPVQRWGGVRVVVGVSGGADSVALACAMCEIANLTKGNGSSKVAGDLVLAHFNHGLRGAASDGDEQFAGDLAAKLGCEYVVQRQAASTTSTPITDEATLSQIRRDFFIETAKKSGARYIALAHHQDDNVETFTHHLLRGTGPAGLCGMPAFRDIHDDLVLARPLLRVTREDLRQYLVAIGQTFRDDVTNHETTYTRNWLRNTLLPYAKERFPNADEAFSRLMGTLTQWRELIDRLADQWLDTNLVSGNPIIVQRDESGDPAIVVAAMQRLWDRNGFPRGEMIQSQWNDVAGCILGTRAECPMLPGAIRIVVEDDCVQVFR